tara:strand:+ start:580 stop:1032 length:453 start_codon:yes stop_codon:yes gene_type:complete
MQIFKRMALILAAAGVTFGLIVISIVVYQYTVMEPETPHAGDCQLKQLEQTQDRAAEVHRYECTRGSETTWQGTEVWLYEPLTEDWQRMLTVKGEPCVRLRLNERRLTILHSGNKLDFNLAEPVFIYKEKDGTSRSLAVEIDNQATTCKG